MTELRNSINSKEIPESANLNKILNIVESKGWPSNLATHIEILTPKQIFQRLPIALAQVKAGNTSESLLSEI